ncbi:MAG: transcriptional repressor [Candidatus Marinimicrobia bacterium]|jgi:Fe2+ or Zn2+ uptake regulation protein|nr:transcriptional repressor [Candidatus Neomarinimicrobiota bacterium]MBT3947657.1 transcriptional repressor [Candidatus Neomarinimicrobiota bacterium]MBT4064725.1 transcriptional repressor [Candidatus Neomarinimicrobiota bacterium]MBT4308074.1 transcriptional repressor [Candidatus Neomarinimicrobiota bacterium]MBT4452432.1 transcriptional repressor [Candidatus Neomarinimicrobiota bacterium]|tara:strand:+ start:584 stop:961 length:378 start_codon:yes stop_codon:yes gene_type:complete
MRFSHQRESIQSIVYSTNSHPTADWVFQKAKKVVPNISLGTVYRNLKQLEDVGLIKTIYDGNIARYDWNQAPHDHLKCKECGELIDIELIDDDVRRKVKNKYQFEVDDVKMVIIGTCHKHKNKGK